MRILLLFLIGLLALVLAVIVVFIVLLAPADRRLLFNRVKTVTIGDTKREYYVVNGSTETEKPLIIGLHGYRDMSRWLAVYSGLNVLAEQEDVVLALPNGQRQSWNGVFCCGWSSENDVNDVAFIAEMIESIKADHQIDASRIYVVGFSNGGILAQKLLAERPDLFAGGVSVMSGVGDRRTTLDIDDAKAPILFINGTRDNYIPIDEPSTQRDFNFVPANETAQIWADHYGLTGKQSQETSAYEEFTWTNDIDNQLIQRLYDSSHRWPNWRLWGFPNEAPQSTQDIWTFLNQHSLPQED
jgi:polyhydroxybutyrate depolymerase